MNGDKFSVVKSKLRTTFEVCSYNMVCVYNCCDVLQLDVQSLILAGMYLICNVYYLGYCTYFCYSIYVVDEIKDPDVSYPTGMCAVCVLQIIGMRSGVGVGG